MRTLLIGDIHISDESIKEIDSIFDNDIFKIKVDRVIQLGDLFDKNRPTPKEIKFATKLIHKMSTLYKEVILLAGNGTHEFLNNVAIIEYLKELSGKIKIITKDHFIEDNVYYGHHMLYSSKLEYGTGKCGVKDLEKYNYAVLAHQHEPQKFTDTIFHIGSIRYQHFNEVTDEFKRVAILTDNNKIEFVTLESPIKMQDFFSLDALEKANKNIKARLVINSFADFKKSINEIHKFKNKFHTFKVKLDFEKEVETVEKASTSNKKLEEIIADGINKINDKDVRDMLKEALNG